MTARPSRPMWPGQGSSRRFATSVVAALALVVAACGDDDPGGDADGIVVEDTTDEDDGAGAAAQYDDSPQDDEAAEPADDADTDGTAGTGGPNEHRPPPAAEPDCAAVTASPPGAIITFPSDNDPSWLDAGPGPVTVEVVGCSDSFEANIQYDAFHGQDMSPTLSGFTQGGTLGNWGAFSFEETYWTPGDWTVVIFVDDAASGDRVEYDEVTFTVS